MNAWWQDDARSSDRPQVFVLWARRFVLHAGAWLRQKVLDDDFLYVTVPSMRSRNRFEGIDAIFTRFADTDQDASGEWNF